MMMMMIEERQKGSVVITPFFLDYFLRFHFLSIEKNPQHYVNKLEWADFCVLIILYFKKMIAACRMYFDLKKR